MDKSKKTSETAQKPTENKGKKGAKKKDERTRNWTLVVYPESAPENWREVLDDLHVPWVESPLHDKDFDPNGEPKKAHWHVLLMFDGNKSYSQICEITEKLKCPVPKKVENVRGLVRYMVHMDNPDKAQYDRAGIVTHGGADIASMLNATKTERYELIREMMMFINEQGIVEMKALLDYAMLERFDDWFPLLCDNSAYILGEYIKSNRHGGRTI